MQRQRSLRSPDAAKNAASNSLPVVVFQISKERDRKAIGFKENRNQRNGKLNLSYG